MIEEAESDARPSEIFLTITASEPPGENTDEALRDEIERRWRDATIEDVATNDKLLIACRRSSFVSEELLNPVQRIQFRELIQVMRANYDRILNETDKDAEKMAAVFNSQI